MEKIKEGKKSLVHAIIEENKSFISDNISLYKDSKELFFEMFEKTFLLFLISMGKVPREEYIGVFNMSEYQNNTGFLSILELILMGFLSR